MFQALKEYIPPEEFKYLDFNMVVNWLKHPRGEDPFSFPESEAADLIDRAISKFHAVYDQTTKLMEAFGEWYWAYYNIRQRCEALGFADDTEDDEAGSQ